jgi:hypothetical protein
VAFIYTLTNAAVTGTDPAGTDLISLGDDNIRAFKSGMIERINSRFVDVNSDPWIIKSPAGGSGNTQALIPTTDNLYTLGEAARRWSDVRSVLGTIATLAVTASLATAGGTAVFDGVPGRTVIQSSTGADAHLRLVGVAASGHFNWSIIKSWTIANSLQFVPSTVADGATFTTPAASLTTAGVLTATTFVGNLTGSVLTAAQGNITSLGNLTIVNIVNAAGAILSLTGSRAYAIVADSANNLVFSDTTGGTNRWVINSVGHFSPAVDNTYNIGDVTHRASGIFAVNLTGTLQTAAQGNITSLGNLAGLTVSSGTLLHTGIIMARFEANGGGASGGTGPGIELYKGGIQAYNRTTLAYAPMLIDASSFTFGQGVVTATLGFSGNLTGTILTAAQGNITSVGTLVNLAVTNSIVANGGINMSNFVGAVQVVGGTAGLSIRNNLNNADNIITDNAGNTTVRGTLTVSGASITGTLVGNVTGNLTGTVLTAAQTNITSLGTLTGLAIAGSLTMSGGGQLQESGGTSSNAGFKHSPRASDPTAPTDGEVWVTTGGAYKVRLAGVVRTVTVT